MYLSQLVKHPIYFKSQVFGRVLDLIVSGNLVKPQISKILVQSSGRKRLLPVNILKISDQELILTTKKFKKIQLEEKDLLLSEDLLDKQVIDVNNRRVVRVNDVVLGQGKGLEVTGIDVGFDGIARRLYLDKFFKFKSIILPWSLVETFDYETGDIKVRVAGSKLDTLRPADIAEILEEVGAKERLGLVEALDSEIAAEAIEEADEETQVAILEQTPQNLLKKILSKMSTAEIADVFDQIDRRKTEVIYKLLSEEKAKQLKHFMKFSDHVAGGLMDTVPFIVSSGIFVEEATELLRKESTIPETVLIQDRRGKFLGTVQTKDLLGQKQSQKIETLISDDSYVTEREHLDQILELFSAYNLRILPVVGKRREIVGAISVDAIIKELNELEERSEAL